MVEGGSLSLKAKPLAARISQLLGSCKSCMLRGMNCLCCSWRVTSDLTSPCEVHTDGSEAAASVPSVPAMMPSLPAAWQAGAAQCRPALTCIVCHSHVTLVTVPPGSLVTTEIAASRDRNQTVSALCTVPVGSCDGASFIIGISYLGTEHRARVTSHLKPIT